MQPALGSGVLQKIGSELMNRCGSGFSIHRLNHGGTPFVKVQPYCQLDLSSVPPGSGIGVRTLCSLGYAFLYGDDSTLVISTVAEKVSHQET